SAPRICLLHRNRSRVGEDCFGVKSGCRRRLPGAARACPVLLRYLVWGRSCQGVPRGAYRYFSTSVSLFDLGNPFPRPDPHGMRWPARAEAVKDGRVAPPARAWSLTGSSTTAHLLWSG